MATKRSAVELDPDYEDVTEQQNKRQKTLENDGKAVYMYQSQTCSCFWFICCSLILL